VEFKRIEDAAVADGIALQERAGLEIVTTARCGGRPSSGR
jgi:hypothetical protein